MTKNILFWLILLSFTCAYALQTNVNTFEDGADSYNFTLTSHGNITKYVAIPIYSILDNAPMISLTIPNTSMPANNLIFNDSFNRADSTTLGGGWWDTLSSIYNSSKSYIENKALVIVGDITQGGTARHNITGSIYPENVTFIFNCNGTTTSQRSTMIFSAFPTGDLSKIGFCASGNIWRYNGGWSALTAINPQQNYSVSMTLNATPNRYEIYLDGVHIGDTAIGSNPTSLFFNGETGVTANTKLTIMNLSLFSTSFSPHENQSLNVTWAGSKGYGTLVYSTLQSNLTLNTTSANTALTYCNCSGCSTNGNLCNIPLSIVRNDTSTLEYNLTMEFPFNYTYGVYSCYTPGFNQSILNMSYYDEITDTAITSTNEYQLGITTPFNQSINGIFHGNYSDNLCTNINITERGYNYEIYGNVLVSKDGYNSRIYTNGLSDPYITENTPVATLSLYLLSLGNSTVVTLNINDILTSVDIENALVSMYLFTGGSYQLITTKLSDITGDVVLDYQENKLYRFIVSKDGYNTYQFDLNPITSSSYNVYLSRSQIVNNSPQYGRVSVEYSPTKYYNNITNDFTFWIWSPYYELNSYGYSIAYPGGTINITGEDPSGELLTSSFTMPSATAYDRVKVTYFYDTNTTGRKTFIYYHDIIISPLNNTMISANNQTYGLGIFERLLIVFFIVVLVAGIATLSGSPAAGMVLGLLIFGYFVLRGFVPFWSFALTLIIGIIILSVRSE